MINWLQIEVYEWDPEKEELDRWYDFINIPGLPRRLKTTIFFEPYFQIQLRPNGIFTVTGLDHNEQVDVVVKSTIVGVGGLINAGDSMDLNVKPSDEYWRIMVERPDLAGDMVVLSQQINMVEFLKWRRQMSGSADTTTPARSVF